MKATAGGSMDAGIVEQLETRMLLSGTDPLGDFFGATTTLETFEPDSATIVGNLSKPTRPGTTDDIGNTFSDARAITLDASGSASLAGRIDYQGDVDVLMIVPTLSGAMKVRQTPLTNNKNSVSGYLSAYCETTLLIRDADGSDITATISFDVVSGETYYLKIAALNGSTGKYTISIATILPTPEPEPDPEPEPTAPDLTVYDVSYTAGTYPPGGGFSIQGIQENVGTADVEASDVFDVEVRLSIDRVWGNLDDLVVYAGRNYDGLAAGISQSFQGNALTPSDAPEGVYRVVVKIDSGRVVPESDELNNLWWSTIADVIVDQPDSTPDPQPDPDPPPDPTPPDEHVPGSSVRGVVESLEDGLRLVVLGTDGSDSITLSQSANTITLMTLSGSLTFEGAFACVQVYGFGGQDDVRLTYTLMIDAVVYGGDGNDDLFEAGPGSGSLHGGAGNDLLVTVGGGRDAVFGEGGFDSFWVDGSDIIGDVEAGEIAGGSVHIIAEFYQPTADPADHVSLEIAGEDIVDPTARYAYSDYSDNVLFTDGPEYDDVIQGAVGDCYFMAVLSSLADSDPAVIEQMIAPMGDGTYGVRFYRDDGPVYVRVDPEFPRSPTSLRPAYGQLTPDGELWVALTEKAYAQFRFDENSYPSLDGGAMEGVYVEITNAPAETVLTISLSDDALVQYVSGNLQDGHPVSAGTGAGCTSPIIGCHAYVVKSIENVGGQWYVTVYNVWGVDGKTWDSDPGDGLLMLPLELFCQNFFCLSVSLA